MVRIYFCGHGGPGRHCLRGGGEQGWHRVLIQLLHQPSAISLVFSVLAVAMLLVLLTTRFSDDRSYVVEVLAHDIGGR